MKPMEVEILELEIPRECPECQKFSHYFVCFLFYSRKEHIRRFNQKEHTSDDLLCSECFIKAIAKI